MKKQICMVCLCFFAGMAGLYAQNDSTGAVPPVWKRGFFLRTSIQLPSSIGFVQLRNMRRFLDNNTLSGDRRGPFRASQSVAEIGTRIRHWSVLISIAYPSIDPGDDNFTLHNAGIAVERTVFQSRNYRIDLGVGSTVYVCGLRIEEPEPKRKIVFSDLPNTDFNTTPVITNLGGALDVYVSLAQREKRRTTAGGITRIGYRHGVSNRAWESFAFDLVEAPTDRLRMFYIQGLLYISRNR
jgi:hypothetical protein